MSTLRPALSRFDMTMIAIGSMIGSGIFLTPSLIAEALPAPLLILIAWVVGGLMALTGALTFAELSSMMPRAGGVYVFLNEGFGGLAGFLYGWAYLLVVNTGGIAALSVAFATYFTYFVPLGHAGTTIVAVIGIVIITIVNVIGVKAGGLLSDVFTVLKLAGILGLIVVGLGWGPGGTAQFTLLAGVPRGSLSSAFAVAMVSVFWSYGGWQHATFTASEAVDPRRTVPFAMITGTIAVVVLYLLANVAYMLLLPVEAIGGSSHVAADAVGTVLGPVGGSLIAIAIFISTFGSASVYTLTVPRIYYAMAADGVFFRTVARIHPRFQTPAIAIILQSAWTIGLVLLWGTFENLISYTVFLDWVFFALTAATIFIFRRRLPDVQRPYRAVGYPLTPLFFVAISVWFVANTLIEKPSQAWAGIALLALGIPVYYYWKRKNTPQTA
jgi:APA family basic amino acid/polyamine antiporter